MSTDARKLACFESLLADSDVVPVAGDSAEHSGAAADTAGATLESVIETEIETDADAVSAGGALEALAETEPSPLVPEVDPIGTAATVANEMAVSPTAAVAEAAAPTTESRSSPDLGQDSETLSDDFGREHVANVADEPEQRVTATVTNVTRDRTKRLVFQFENGQVWRQQEARRFQYPKNRAFDVEIARGIFGDYQLRVNGEGRMTRIKRLQ